jgi:hypothetical protein
MGQAEALAGRRLIVRNVRTPRPADGQRIAVRTGAAGGILNAWQAWCDPAREYTG